MINILADASLRWKRRAARGGGRATIEKVSDIYEVVQVSRLYQYVTKKASDRPEVGHIWAGRFRLHRFGHRVEVVAFPAHEPPERCALMKRRKMARDSVFNAALVMRRVTGRKLSDYDLFISRRVGGGNIDGPSAGTAILAAIVSAGDVWSPLRQDALFVTVKTPSLWCARPPACPFESLWRS